MQKWKSSLCTRTLQTTVHPTCIDGEQRDASRFWTRSAVRDNFGQSMQFSLEKLTNLSSTVLTYSSGFVTQVERARACAWSSAVLQISTCTGHMVLCLHLPAHPTRTQFSSIELQQIAACDLRGLVSLSAFCSQRPDSSSLLPVLASRARDLKLRDLANCFSSTMTAFIGNLFISTCSCDLPFH